MILKNINQLLLDELKIPEDCCCYCGRRMNCIQGSEKQATIDHVIPKSNGGTNHQLNRLPCCQRCNLMKGDNSLEYFLDQIRARFLASVGNGKNSKNRKKRYQHMEQHTFLIMTSIEKYKKQVYAYKRGAING